MVSDNVNPDLREQGITSGAGINLFSDANAQLGGPIIKDKLRFFASFRDWRIHRNVPNFPKSENTDIFSALGTLNYQLNAKNRIDVTGDRPDLWKPNRNASAPAPARHHLDRGRRVPHLPGALQLADQEQRASGRAGELLDVDFPLKFQPGVTRQNTTELTTGDQFGVSGQAYKFYRSRLAIGATLSLYKSNWAGAGHDVKFGYEYGHQVSDSDQQVLDGVTLNIFDGAPNYLIAWNAPVETRSRYTDNTLFVQDNITKGRLAVNLGLRFQHTNGYLPAQSSPAGPFSPPAQLRGEGRHLLEQSRPSPRHSSTTCRATTSPR